MVESAATAERTVQELFDLTGRVALVTGGCGHLGGASCRSLAEAGAMVLVGSRDRQRAESFAQTLPAHGSVKHAGVALDHLGMESIEARFAEAVGVAGQIDIVVNNGHEPLGADWSTVSGEEFTRHLGNATGYFLLARCLRNHAVARRVSASVILLGSMYGVVGSYPEAYDGICAASPVAYHALKGGIVQMTRHLAVYWAADRVRVNCLSPGPFPGARAPAEMVARLKEKSPLRRMGVPEELKGPLLLLASDAGSYITGQNLIVDGGWTAW